MRRRRLARSIYEDPHGIEVVVQRGGRVRRQRYPRGTPLSELADDRDALIDELETDRTTMAHRRGTLAADVRTALATVASWRHRQDIETLLGHWLRAETTTAKGEAATFGALPRAALTPLQIKTQLAVFSAAETAPGRRRFAPKTVKELRRVLAWLYTTIDGPDARNPVRATKAPRVRYDEPRGLDYDVIEWILAHAPDRGRPQDGPPASPRSGSLVTSPVSRPTVSMSKLRARVMAYTGMHQIEIGRLEAGHVDLARGRVWIRAREKGAGAPGAWHRLTGRGAEALQALVDAGGLGPFDPRSLARSWRIWLAAARAAWDADPEKRGRPWPVHADARPYDLRHSFGTLVYLETGDIRAAQAMLRHRQASTTDRYTRAGVPRRVEAAVAALDQAFRREVSP
ncbi:MAG: site-specific integrase [Vicinamibacterales bacterium]